MLPLLLFNVISGLVIDKATDLATEHVESMIDDLLPKAAQKELDTKVGKITMFVDRFTGLAYTLAIQGEESQLFFHNDTKVVAETFETRAEGSDEVVFTVKAPLWKKLVKGTWIVDDDMRPLTDTSIATSLTNFMGE